MKRLPWLFAFLICISVVQAADLSDFPDYFSSSSKRFTAQFVLGRAAPSGDVGFVLDLTAAYESQGYEFPLGHLKFAEDIADITNGNYMVIGTPCDNPAVMELLIPEIV